MRVKPAQSARPCSTRWAAPATGRHLAAAVEAAVAVLASNETAANDAEVALRVARQVEADTRQAHDEARRKAERLQTEVRTLTNLLKAADNDLWPALVDQLKVEQGYEAALGAALGDDIDASSDEGAPTHWRGLPPLEDGISLPGEAQPLSNFVQAPQALARRLSHIGVVSRSLGQALQAQLQLGPAAGVARRRCLALGRIYLGGRCAECGGKAPGRAQPPFAS